MRSHTERVTTCYRRGPPGEASTVNDLIRMAGYPLEIHTVTTEDGYILQLQRMPRLGSREVAFFMHGVFDTALTWVSSGVTGGCGLHDPDPEFRSNPKTLTLTHMVFACVTGVRLTIRNAHLTTACSVLCKGCDPAHLLLTIHSSSRYVCCLCNKPLNPTASSFVLLTQSNSVFLRPFSFQPDSTAPSCPSFALAGSQAFAAWDQGYDVWLGNSRNNPPRCHVDPARRGLQYWRYNLNQLAIYDMSAMLDHVHEVSWLGVTAQSGLSKYVGLE